MMANLFTSLVWSYRTDYATYTMTSYICFIISFSFLQFLEMYHQILDSTINTAQKRWTYLICGKRSVYEKIQNLPWPNMSIKLIAVILTSFLLTYCFFFLQILHIKSSSTWQQKQRFFHVYILYHSSSSSAFVYHF